MTRKITTVILTAITLFAIVPNVRAEIASKAYVDDTENNLIYGTTTPTQQQVSDITRYNGVAGKVNHVAENSLSVNGQLGNMILVTNDDGEIRGINAIKLGFLKFPTPPSECSTRGCMLMFYDDQYVWEPVTRDNNETISTTGAVGANDKVIQTEYGAKAMSVRNVDNGDWKIVED